MDRSRILAHRGWWTDPADKNSAAALTRALAAGFGIETDFRDLDGALMVSHDPARHADDLREAGWFFDEVMRTGNTGRLALNIKADGLQDMLRAARDGAGVPPDQAYAFDMAVPDALGYLARGFPAYSRLSEYEATPSFVTRAAGVWVDNFTGDYPQVDRAIDVMSGGLRAAIVSPELHGRDHHALWDDIAAARLHENPLFELCTDLPDAAFETFGTPT